MVWYAARFRPEGIDAYVKADEQAVRRWAMAVNGVLVRCVRQPGTPAVDVVVADYRRPGEED